MASVVDAVLSRRLEAIRKDLESGRIKFYNTPSIWTEEILEATAYRYLMSKLWEESKWN